MCRAEEKHCYTVCRYTYYAGISIGRELKHENCICTCILFWFDSERRSYYCVHVPVYLIIVVDQNSAGNEHRAGQTAAQQGTGGERGRDWGAQILHAEKGKLDTPCQKKVPHPLIKPTDGQR